MSFLKVSTDVIKKYFLTIGLLIFSCATVEAQVLNVDQDTKDLIITSIVIEVSSNLSLRTADGTPYFVFYDDLDILGESTRIEGEDSFMPLHVYNVTVGYQSVDGNGGLLICEAIILNELNEKRPLKASCGASSFSGNKKNLVNQL